MEFRRYLNVQFANLHLNFDGFDQRDGAKSSCFDSEREIRIMIMQAGLGIISERAALLRVVSRTHSVKASNGSSAQRVRLGWLSRVASIS